MSMLETYEFDSILPTADVVRSYRRKHAVYYAIIVIIMYIIILIHRPNVVLYII